MCHFLWRTCYDEVSTFITTIRTKVDNMVGTFDDIEVMFNNQYAVITVNEGIEGVK